MRVSRRNAFAFPAGRAPGFDPTHVATRSVKMSAVPIGANFLNLFPINVGAPANSPTAMMHGIIGPSVKCSFNGSVNSGVTLPCSNFDNSSVTLAAICVFNNFATAGNVLTSTADTVVENAGIALVAHTTSGTFSLLRNNVAFDDSGITLSVDVPYFLAATFNSSDSLHNYVAVDLRSGKLFTDTNTIGNTFNAPTISSFPIGASNNTNGGVDGATIAAAMISGRAMLMAELKLWALDPWSFWYPQNRVQRAAPLMFLHPDGDDAVGNWTRGS